MKTTREWSEIAFQRIQQVRFGDSAQMMDVLEQTFREAIESYIESSRQPNSEGGNFEKNEHRDFQKN